MASRLLVALCMISHVEGFRSHLRHNKTGSGLFIRSHRHQYLQGNDGAVKLSANSQEGKQWVVSEATSAMSRQIHWATHPEKCLDVRSGGISNGVKIQLWDCQDGNGNQMFIIPDAGVPGQIQWAAHPEKCLDVSGGVTDNGNNIQLWDCQHGHENMMFVVPDAGVSDEIHWATHPEKCLDVNGGIKDNGNNIHIYDCENGHANMMFQIVQALCAKDDCRDCANSCSWNKESGYCLLSSIRPRCQTTCKTEVGCALCTDLVTESSCNVFSSCAWSGSVCIPTPAPTPAPRPDDAFTLVVIPDIQFMTLENNGWARQHPRLAWPEKYYAQGEWVASSKELLNIKAVIQVGDLVETGCDDAHWKVFNKGWDPIHATGLPYSLAAGNHDCDNLYGCVPRGWSCYNRQVPHFLDRVSFPAEFMSPGNYQNMITLFEASGIKFIIVSVEWNALDDALAWARHKIEQHSDRWVIFNTHFVQASPGVLELAKSIPKTFMVTQGHDCVYGEEWHHFHQGAGEQPFIEMLIDYQCYSNGYLKYFTIDKAAGKVKGYTYNPFTKDFRKGSTYEFSFDFRF